MDASNQDAGFRCADNVRAGYRAVTQSVRKTPIKVMSAEIQCRFEKALISGANVCAQAKRVEIGERIVCLCRSTAAAQRCERYLSLLRQNARFVFRQIRDGASILSNYQEICLQCGGLQGLSALTCSEPTDDKLDVNILLGTAEDEYQGFDNIPMDRIVPRIAAYNPRPHRKRK